MFEFFGTAPTKMTKPNNFITESKHWEVYLNPDQYNLGRSVIAAKREVGTMSELIDEEWLDFAALVKKMESSAKKAFGATMCNWTRLMNNAYQEGMPKPHVHWHFRPRYRDIVDFAGMKFEDKEFGHHYARGIDFLVSDEVFQSIIKAYQENL